MHTSDYPYLFSSRTPVNVYEAVKMALHKFPRLRNQIHRTKPLKPKIYYRLVSSYEDRMLKSRRIKRELLDAGVTFYGLLKAESRYLPKILHDNEHIEAVIYGQHNASSAMLIATDERIIYLDKKPMVEMFDEISYEVISGIEFDIHTFFGSVVLHTPVKNYYFRYVNLRCAEKFARHIEKHRLEREPKADQPVIEVKQINQPSENPKWTDMAGYYWLPTDEEELKRVQQVTT